MGNAARKARKRAGESFQHPKKTPPTRRAQRHSTLPSDPKMDAVWWELMTGRYFGKDRIWK